MKTAGILWTMMAVIALLVAAMALLVGCGQPAMAVAAASTTNDQGALSTAYEDALDVTGQLALGTLRLEDTAQAVTETQAATLLPLWRVLQGDELQGDTERDAVLAQIEASMTEEQIEVIAAMQLTQADVQIWVQNEGPTASNPALDGDAVPAKMPQRMSEDQFANMSDQDRAAQRARLGGSVATGRGGAGSQGLVSAVIDLLSAQSGTVAGAVTHSDAEIKGPASEPLANESSAVEMASLEAVVTEPVVAEPEAVATEPATALGTGSGSDASPEKSLQAETSPNVVVYVVRAGNTLSAIAQAYGVTVEAVVEANDIQDPDTIYVGQTLTIPDPALVPETVAVSVPSSVEVQMAGSGSTRESTMTVTSPALEWLPDDNPGPPLTIEVSANVAIQDPLVERSQTYVVTGIVCNDGDQTYAVSDILVTFYDASGFRGTFTPAIRDGKLVGGEWHWHGETNAEFAALLLAPGEEWPFYIEITAQDMASFLIHPDAAPTGRQSAPVVLSDVTLIEEDTGYLRIGGTATNGNPFAVQNVTVSGVLLDASGQIVSVGSVYVLQEGIASGASVHFDLRIEKEAHTSYQLYAQAERD